MRAFWVFLLKKNLKSTGATATFKGLSPGVKIIFSLNKLDFKPSFDERS